MRDVTLFGILLICSRFGTQVTSLNVGTFWHFTDFHVNMSYDIRDNTKKWGEYDQDTSPIVAFTGIELGNDYGYAENKPDFVIWGGDSAPHGSTTTARDLRESIAFLSNHMKNAFTPDRIPVIPVIGNHDVYPPNDMSPIINDQTRIDWCTELATNDSLWKVWIDQGSMPENGRYRGDPYVFENNCYMSIFMAKKASLIILGINSLVWYSNNKLANESIEDPLDQFLWITTMLEWAKSHYYKVLLVMHVPFGAPAYAPNSYRHLKKSYNEKLVEIVRNYSSAIMATIASHEHVDTFRVILDEKYRPVSTMFLGPAVNPLHMDGIGSNNPRIRQFFYDRDNGVILNYRQFYLDLTQAAPSWQYEYNAIDEYNLTALTATELGKLLDEFTVEDDKDGRWKAYWKHQLGGRPHDKPPKRQDGECPKARSVCRCEQICSIRHLDMKALDKCLEICHSSETPHLDTIEELVNGKGGAVSNAGTIVGIVIGVLLLAGVLVGVGFIGYRRWRNSRY